MKFTKKKKHSPKDANTPKDKNICFKTQGYFGNLKNQKSPSSKGNRNSASNDI
jgi:hypothetical protein